VRVGEEGYNEVIIEAGVTLEFVTLVEEDRGYLSAPESDAAEASS